MTTTDKPRTLEQIKRDAVMAAMDRHDRNRSKVAKELDISRDRLRGLLKKWGVPPAKAGRHRTL